MAISLTPEQQEQLIEGGDPAVVIDPQTDRQYVLLPVEDYESFRDARDQAALRATAARTLGRRIAEGE